MAAQPVTVQVTDAATPARYLASVVVALDSVELVAADGRSVALVASGQGTTVDLLALRNGELKTLGATAVVPGSYQTVRLTFGAATVHLSTGAVLVAAADPRTIDVPASLVVDQPRTLLVDVDLARSFAFSGSGLVPSSVTFTPAARASAVGTGGDLRGKVVDGSGRDVPGATVRVASGSTSAATITGPDGGYAFLELPAGSYTIDVESDQLSSPARTSATVSPGATTRQDVSLPAAFTGASSSVDLGALQLLEVRAQESVQPGEQIRITWRTQGAASIVRTFVHWGRASHAYEDVGLVQSSSLGSASFAEVILAPSRANTVYYSVTAVDAAGRVVESPEQRCEVHFADMTGAMVYERHPEVAIPDDEPLGVTVPIDVADVGTLANLEVRIDIEHPQRTDLTVDLVAPSGRTLRLYEAVPGVSDPNHLEAGHADIYGSFNGTFRCTGDVQTLFGQSTKGRWLVRVVDHAPDGTGVLHLATLLIQFDARAGVKERLPNLVTLPPDELSIVESWGTRYLLLSNVTTNFGDGPLELRGQVDTTTGETNAYQRIFSLGVDAYGNPRWEFVREKLVGHFVFAAHKDHNHFHFDRFATYTLVDDKFQLVGTSDKVSHCLEDYRLIDPTIPNATAKRTYACSPTIQGISLGWADVYAAAVSGQSIAITGVPDGVYYVIAEATSAFEESKTDRLDNSAATRVRIAGDSVTILEKVDGVELARRRAAAAKAP